MVKCQIGGVCGEGSFAKCPSSEPAPARLAGMASLATLFLAFGTWRLYRS